MTDATYPNVTAGATATQAILCALTLSTGVKNAGQYECGDRSAGGLAPNLTPPTKQQSIINRLMLCWWNGVDRLGAKPPADLSPHCIRGPSIRLGIVFDVC